MEQKNFIRRKLEEAAKTSLRTEEKIYSLFTEKEMNLIRDSWNKNETPTGMSFNDILILKITSYLKSELVDKNFFVNQESLFKKIKDLSDYQALILLKVSINKR